MTMYPLFSQSSLKHLKSLALSRTLYVFDFDGTLSRIVRAPSRAGLPRETARLVRELGERAPVAIVSGRAIADLRDRLGFEPSYVVGNHGLEGLEKPDGLRRARESCIRWTHALSAIPLGAGVEVENKKFSLAIHYRRSRRKRLSRRLIQDAIDRLTPVPRVIAGKCVFNLVPESAPHKGAAVLALMKRSRTKQAFYIGDDDTDEDVFALPGDRIMKVRVGRKRASQAHYFIARQSQINRVLRELISAER